MRAKQRRQRAERRRAHGGDGDRPRRVLSQASYPKVKQGHIVPATYQRNFAANGRVAVHVVGSPGCHPMKAENAGTRGPYYRRRRQDGSEIDDVEACLAVMEDLAGPVLAEVAGGAPMDAVRKGVLAQFLAVQMLRGPVFFSTVHQVASQVIAEGVAPETVAPEVLASSGGDIAAVRERALTAFDHRRFVDMLGQSQKASSVLACMRWRVLRFAAPVVAYSDQPVVVWPVGKLAIDERPDRPTLGPLSALEIRVPLSSQLILLMTWDDLSDVEASLRAPTSFAAETNALVIAQADKQWMHRPDEEPPIARHLLRPVAAALDPAYDHRVVWSSQRHRIAQTRFEKVSGRRFVNTVQMITSVTRGPIETHGSSPQRGPRRPRRRGSPRR